ncbi:MAG: glycosyltransferase family 2 protein [Kiritimatiellae bacterium]|nr:glycosyltransferase family 2 protein [Kiritimatiellia bacterium]
MPDSLPLATAIVPVFNAEATLRRCLDSLLAQTCGDWEAVCIDDGSTDSSLSILAEYARRDPRIRSGSGENRGTHCARKRAVAAARGGWCLFLDPDDSLDPSAVERLSPILSSTSAGIVVFGADVSAASERLGVVAASLAAKFNPSARTLSRDDMFDAVFVKETIPGHLIAKAVRTSVAKAAFSRMSDRRIVFQEDLCALYMMIAGCSGAQVVGDRLYRYTVGDGISYRPFLSREEYFGSFAKFEELACMKAYRSSAFPDGSPADAALARLETRMALASVSEAMERLESEEDGREGVRLLMEVCSPETVSAALARWFRLKGDALADKARRFGLSSILGSVALRQLDFVWRGHNARLRDHDREIAALRSEVDALRSLVDGLCARPGRQPASK